MTTGRRDVAALGNREVVVVPLTWRPSACVQGDVDTFFREICSAADVQKVELVLLSTICWDTHTTTILDFASRYCALIADPAVADVVMAEVYHYAVAAACGASARCLSLGRVGFWRAAIPTLTLSACRPCLSRFRDG